jgi:2',3'-cyclic-nucleotide 2'-phosphodiesterase (5'-nucleotidase family)
MGRVLSLSGYDALAVGNHDFDSGYQRLLEISA